MRNVVVTGGNRGLGEGVAKHFLNQGDHVCVTVRSQQAFESVKRWPEAQSHSDRLVVVIWNAETPEIISDAFQRELDKCDVLINNAGTDADLYLSRPMWGDHDMLLSESPLLMKALQVNMNAPRVLMGKVVRSMRGRGYGRIVNVASARATAINRVGESNSPAYRLSKAALVSMTKEAAFENQFPNVKFNALCPGWCKTRMGGPSAPEEISTGVDRIVRLCNIDENGPHGEFFVDGQPVLMA